MPRILTIWLPRWPVQRRLSERPELRKAPVFVCRRERRGVMTIVSWAWVEPPRQVTSAGMPAAPRAGKPIEIPAGTSLAEGMALVAIAHGSRACHRAEIATDDPAADRAALEQLARWCRRFSPTVAIETVDGGAPGPTAAADCIFLDVTGTAGFFGGEGRLVRTAVWTLAARGFHARAAIADTPAAAWAAAHHTHLLAGPPPRPGGRPRRWVVVPPAEAQAALLAGLPLAALRLEAATIGLLYEVGIDSIGGVLRLSARSLAARFPPDLGRRRAQLLGTLAEPLAVGGGAADDELPQAVHTFDVPVATAGCTADAVAAVIERLVAACLVPLMARAAGVLALQVRFEPAVSSPAATCAPTVIDVGLFRPSLSARHLVELVQLRLGRVRLPRELDGIAVEVVAAGPAACRQRSLFGEAGGPAGRHDTAESRATDLALLLDRLSGRLGRPAVFEPRAVADAQPEHAWIAAVPGSEVTASGGAARRASNAPGRLKAGDVRNQPAGRQRLVAGRRPIWMAARPQRIEPLRIGPVAIAAGATGREPEPPWLFRVGGAVHRVAHAHGPERIETAWWRGPIVRRDYYVVETEMGSRLWIFRRLKDGAWFLHGRFA